MKIINKKGMIFDKISIIDIFIVAVACLGLLFVYSFLDKEEVKVRVENEFYYTFEAGDVNENFAESIEVGTTLYNSSRNYYVGEVVEVTEVPYYVWTEDLLKGEFYKVEDSSKSTVHIKIKAEGTINDTSFYAGQELIKVGSVFPIKGLGFASHGVVIDIEEVSNEEN